MPFSLRWFIEELERLDPVVGIMLIAAGLVFILVGARVFQALMVISFGCIGFAAGFSLPAELVWRLLAGIGAGAALALASRVLPRPGIAVLGGGWFATAAMLFADHLGAEPPVVLVVGGLAFLVAFSLAFVLYYEVIAAVMSFEGTLLILSGLVVWLSQYSVMWVRLRIVFVETPGLVAFLLLAGTVTGYYTQLAERQKKQIGTSG